MARTTQKGANTVDVDDRDDYDEGRNIILSLISQLRPGSDLSRITLPTFILERKSMLERILSNTPSSYLLGAPTELALAKKTPSVVEVFPHFSYPDVNFWIWVFGWRYRVILRGWQRSIGTEMERRAHWSGLALAAF